MTALDETHDPKRLSFEVSANSHFNFPLQNLPFGVFSPPGGGSRGGIAIGDMILDLRLAVANGLFDGEFTDAAKAASNPTLNGFLALGREPRSRLRRQIFALLSQGSAEETRVRACLHRASDCALHLPVRIGDYTDFYVGIHHATAVGKLFRPDNPLLPNYKYLPIGYHGRSSSVVVSGTPVHRPAGQTQQGRFGPSQAFDYELE